MHDTHKQDYLAQAERHIPIAHDRIARQTKIIALEQHRDTIFDRCKT